MAVADRIRDERKRQNLTQEALARRAGLTLNGYADIERGIVQDPHVSSLASIAKALGLTLAELLEEPVPLGKAPEPGLTETLAQLAEVPFPDVLEFGSDELEELRARARDDASEFAALTHQYNAVAEEYTRLREAGAPPEELTEVDERRRRLRKLWKVTLFERLAPAINADPRRSPEAPVYPDTTDLPLDEAFDVWRDARVPVGAR